MVQHRLDRAAVLALEPVIDVQARLHDVQPLGIGVEPVEVAAQLRTQVLGLDPQAAHALGERVQLGVGPGHAAGQPLGLRQQGSGAGPVVGRDRLASRGRRRAQAVDLPQPPALGLQTGLLLGRGRQLLDLLDLEREQAEIAVAAAGAVAQALQVALRLLHARVGGGDPAAQPSARRRTRRGGPAERPRR